MCKRQSHWERLPCETPVTSDVNVVQTAHLSLFRGDGAGAGSVKRSENQITEALFGHQEVLACTEQVMAMLTLKSEQSFQKFKRIVPIF